MSALVENILNMVFVLKAYNPDGDYRIVCSQVGKICLVREFNEYYNTDVKDVKKILDVPVETNMFATDDIVYLIDFRINPIPLNNIERENESLKS